MTVEKAIDLIRQHSGLGIRREKSRRSRGKGKDTTYYLRVPWAWSTVERVSFWKIVEDVVFAF
jgi:hypothetical protein